MIRRCYILETASNHPPSQERECLVMSQPHAQEDAHEAVRVHATLYCNDQTNPPKAPNPLCHQYTTFISRHSPLGHFHTNHGVFGDF
jgi:hypothetical protein